MVRLLTSENVAYDLNDLPTEDINFGVLHYPKTNEEPDFYFPPIVQLDVFKRPAACLVIGDHRLMMPLNWCVLIADRETADVEVMELKSLNDREFKVFVLNPIDGYMPTFLDITIENLISDVEWWFPATGKAHMLAVPLTDGPSPPCAYFCRDASRFPPVLDISEVFA